jgi:glycerophosphoryl diester phosphodiesterase
VPASRPSFFRESLRCFRASWKALIVTDLLYKLLAFIVLTPLLAIVLRIFLELGGQPAVADFEIVHFLLGPLGWLCAIVAGAYWLAIVAWEQASLLAIVAARRYQQTIPPLPALGFAARRWLPISQLTSWLAGLGLLFAIPWLVLGGVLYRWLLGAHDINFYLNEPSPEFRAALGLGFTLLLAFLGAGLYLVSGWFVALPCLLFEQRTARQAMARSWQLAVGSRWSIFASLSLWLMIVVLVHAAFSLAIHGLGRWLSLGQSESVDRLAGAIGLVLVLHAFAALCLNVLAAASFAILLFTHYQALAPAGIPLTATLPGSPDPTSWPRFTMNWFRVLSLLVMTGLLVMVIGYQLVANVDRDDRVQIMAHRGASDVAPENTLAAIQAAVAAGADWVEIDVQETRDGEVVVIHDSDLMKLSRNPLKIWEASLEDLAVIDIGSWFDPRFAEQRVPRLRELLAYCKGKIKVVIELKYYGHDVQLEQRVAEIVDALAMADEVMIMSLKTKAVQKMKKLRPNYRCGLLLSVSVGDIQRIDADFIAINGRFATPELVRRVHRAGKQVYVWTINAPATQSAMMNRGVDGLLTDKPALARQVLRERATMSLTERLLTEYAEVLGIRDQYGAQ